jgi:type II secretory pathway pseudopilin PulG
MRKKSAGVTLTELLVAILVMSLAMTGAIGFFISHKRVITEQDLSATLAANLRVAMEKLSYDLRGAGYWVPSTLTGWFPWVPGFIANPMITQGAGGAPATTAGGPDTLYVARCTPQPVALLSANAAVSDTSLTLNSTTALDATNRRFIFIGDSEPAQIQSVTGTTITIDTNPATAGNQGLAKAYVTGAPICRVDVVTWSVDTTKSTLNRNDNQGGGAQPVVDGITNLQIIAIAGEIKTRYQVELTGRSAGSDPLTGSPMERKLTSSVSLKN